MLTHIDHLDCDQIKTLFETVGSDLLFQVCQHNKIESIAADALKKCVGVDNIPTYWLDAYQQVNERIDSYMQELDGAAKLLSDHGIEMVALKNSGITRGCMLDMAPVRWGILMFWCASKILERRTKF